MRAESSTVVEASCPVCDGPSSGTAYDEAGVRYANFLCIHGHIWAAHWLTEQDGAA